MSKIMLITSRYTGHGHMSITEALNEQFEIMGGVTVDVVDGFSLLGSQGPYFSKIYNTITRHAPEVWEAAFKASSKSGFVPDTMEYLLRKRFVAYIESEKPDAIVNVHPFFVEPIINEMKRMRLDIPFICLVADPVNVHPLWCDERADLTICPTDEAQARAVEFGVPVEKTIVTGFPTRKAFVDLAKNAPERQINSNRLSCLMLGGGGGAGEIEDYAVSLLENTPHSLTIVCGSNEKLREHLVELLSDRFYGRVTIKGFVHDIENDYASSDVAILRASPNCMFEAIVMGVPMIITGALPGQEADNPKLCTDHNLGVECVSHYGIDMCLARLANNDAARLKEIRECEKTYRRLDSAHSAAKAIYGVLGL